MLPPPEADEGRRSPNESQSVQHGSAVHDNDELREAYVPYRI